MGNHERQDIINSAKHGVELSGIAEQAISHNNFFHEGTFNIQTFDRAFARLVFRDGSITSLDITSPPRTEAGVTRLEQLIIDRQQNGSLCSRVNQIVRTDHNQPDNEPIVQVTTDYSGVLRLDDFMAARLFLETAHYQNYKKEKRDRTGGVVSDMIFSSRLKFMRPVQRHAKSLPEKVMTLAIKRTPRIAKFIIKSS